MRIRRQRKVFTEGRECRPLERPRRLGGVFDPSALEPALERGGGPEGEVMALYLRTSVMRTGAAFSVAMASRPRNRRH